MGKETDNDFLGTSLDDLDFMGFGTQEEEEEVQEQEKKVDDGEEEGKEEKDGEGSEEQKSGDGGEEEEKQQEDEGEQINPIITIAEHLHEKGIIDKPEEFKGTDEEFEQLFITKIEAGIEEYKESFSELSKSFIEYIENGGDPSGFIKVFAEKDFSNIKDSEIEELDDIEEDENRNTLRKEVIKEALLLQGLSEDKIKAKVKKYEDTGILADEAVDALQLVRKYSIQKKQSMIDQQKQDAVNKQKSFDEWVNKTTELIENDLDKIVGVEIDKRTKTEFKDFLLKTNPKTKKTALVEKREKDPYFDIKMAFAAFGGFETVKKETKKKTTTELSTKLKGSGTKGLSRQPSSRQTSSGWSKAIED